MLRTVTEVVNGRETATQIWMVRGDDERIEVPLYVVENGERVDFEMAAGDVLTLTVRELPDAAAPVLMQISGAPGQNVIPIRHEDTKDLAVGRYSADIQPGPAGGLRKTVWPDFEAGNSKRWRMQNTKNFCIVSEVTML